MVLVENRKLSALKILTGKKKAENINSYSLSGVQRSLTEALKLTLEPVDGSALVGGGGGAAQAQESLA